MTYKDKQNLKKLDKPALTKKITDLQKSLVITTQEIRLGKEKNVKKAKNIRQQISLAMTYLNAPDIKPEETK